MKFCFVSMFVVQFLIRISLLNEWYYAFNLSGRFQYNHPSMQPSDWPMEVSSGIIIIILLVWINRLSLSVCVIHKAGVFTIDKFNWWENILKHTLINGHYQLVIADMINELKCTNTTYSKSMLICSKPINLYIIQPDWLV